VSQVTLIVPAVPSLFRKSIWMRSLPAAFFRHSVTDPSLLQPYKIVEPGTPVVLEVMIISGGKADVIVITTFTQCSADGKSTEKLMAPDTSPPHVNVLSTLQPQQQSVSVPTAPSLKIGPPSQAISVITQPWNRW
jgi:hypothetical protein